MKIVHPRVELINPPEYKELLNIVETAGRVCYKSEDKIKEGSAEEFIRNVIKRGHEAVIEHGVLTAKFICDRGVTHEIVRHRLASYCQESTRYCNYSATKFDSEITVIQPLYLEPGSKAWSIWELAMKEAEAAYFGLLNEGLYPQEARAVLPNSLKTEIVMTANLREWRHFCKLRASKAAHPQMREIAVKLLNILKTKYPVFFEDIEV